LKAARVLKRNGHEVFFHDLYQERFDPLLTSVEIPREAPLPPEIKRHCLEIAQAEGIVIIHPNWWGQPPAILKGWVDRVIRPGIAYEFLEEDKGEGIPKGLLKARAALVFNTSNTPAEREQSVFGDPLESLWKDCVFGLCGVENVFRKMFCVVVTSSTNERMRWLEEVEDAVCRYFPGRPG
jgi:putative NADPH-quinone reductase